MGIFTSIKHAFSKAGHAIGNFFHSATSTVSSDVHAVASTIETAATTVYSDVKQGAKTVYTGGLKLSNTVISDIKSTADNTINRTTGILSMPLLLVAGGVAAFLLFSGKNSSINASYNK